MFILERPPCLSILSVPPTREDTVHQITKPWPFDGWIPRAVAFDCDGTLVDTESCWTHAQAELFATRGLSSPRARARVPWHGTSTAVRQDRRDLLRARQRAGHPRRLLYLVTERISATRCPCLAPQGSRPDHRGRPPRWSATRRSPCSTSRSSEGSTACSASSSPPRPSPGKPAPTPTCSAAPPRPSPPPPWRSRTRPPDCAPPATPDGDLGVPSLRGQPLCADAVISTSSIQLIRWIGMAEGR